MFECFLFAGHVGSPISHAWLSSPDEQTTKWLLPRARPKIHSRRAHIHLGTFPSKQLEPMEKCLHPIFWSYPLLHIDYMFHELVDCSEVLGAWDTDAESCRVISCSISIPMMVSTSTGCVKTPRQVHHHFQRKRRTIKALVSRIGYILMFDE